MTALTTHFTLEELLRSATAEQYQLDNTPDATVRANLQRSAELLEAVRSVLGGTPLRITSGYRSAAVNKAVGGSATSAHCFGYAIDFLQPGSTPLLVCRAIENSELLYDQLIHEFGRWTHISFDPRMRRMALTIASIKQGYVNGIHPVN